MYEGSYLVLNACISIPAAAAPILTLRALTGEVLSLGEADQQPAGGLNYVSVNPTIEDIRKPNTHAN